MDVHEQRVSALQSELDLLAREKLAADKQVAAVRHELSTRRAELTVRPGRERPRVRVPGDGAHACGIAQTQMIACCDDY